MSENDDRDRERRLFVWHSMRSKIWTDFTSGIIKTVEERDRQLSEIEFLVAPPLLDRRSRVGPAPCPASPQRPPFVAPSPARSRGFPPYFGKRGREELNSSSTILMFIMFNADCFHELFHRNVPTLFFVSQNLLEDRKTPAFRGLEMTLHYVRIPPTGRRKVYKEYSILILNCFGFLYCNLIFPYYNLIFKLHFNFENKNL